MTEPLANPERSWAVNAARPNLTRREIEERLAAPAGAWELLSGGLANANVLVNGRVLRIYRRDPRTLAVEAALLCRPWTSFRVPALFARGHDFTLLEYVSHGPVLGSAEHGAAVGRALAEIHALSFERAGLLTPELEVETPFPDLLQALIDYSHSVAPRAERWLGDELTAGLIDALEANAPALRAIIGKPVLLHGDFKVSNLHWTDDDRLLVLDWEFAYAGARLSDIGQLFRWSPPDAFVAAFARAYTDAGGALPANFRHSAAVLDLVNLIGLVANRAGLDSDPRVPDVRERIARTLRITSE